MATRKMATQKQQASTPEAAPNQEAVKERQSVAVSGEKAGAMAAPPAVEGEFVEEKRNPLNQVQERLRQFAAQKEQEAAQFVEIASNIEAAIADPATKMTQQQRLLRQAQMQLTANFIADKGDVSRLQGLAVNAAGAAIRTAGESYHTSGSFSNTQELNSWDQTQEVKRDAALLRHHFEQKGAVLSAEKTKAKYQINRSKWDGSVPLPLKSADPIDAA